MLFLLDECVTGSALDALRSAGFEAHTVSDHLLPSAEDQLVASTADSLGAIIVSHDRDFKKLIARKHDGQVKKFRNAHLVKMECKQGRIADRLMAAMPLIQEEYRVRTTMKDKRLIAFIATDFVRIWR